MSRRPREGAAFPEPHGDPAKKRASVYEGLDAVTGFYVAAWQNFHGITWTQDHIRNLASTVVLSYEHAGRPGQTKPGLCAHLFKVRRGRISSLDWVTYYPGVP